MTIVRQLEWISVKDRLPEFCQRVLLSVTTLAGHQVLEMGHLMALDEGWYINDLGTYLKDQVTHWMELPEVVYGLKDE